MSATRARATARKSTSGGSPLVGSVTIDRGRIAEQIFHLLKEEIVSGELAEGTQLPAERELAARYSVSGSTIREALRGLSLVGLIDVRHGSGAYVRGSGDPLMAMSLGTAIRLQGAGVADMIDIFGVLNEHAATSAIERATDAELAAVVTAAQSLSAAASVEEAEEKVRGFYRTLVAAAHNPLLEILCKFLAEVQIELANKATGRSIRKWRTILDNLFEPRMALAMAMAERRHADVSTLSRAFQSEAADNLEQVPQLRHVRVSDRELAGLLSTVTKTISSGD